MRQSLAKHQRRDLRRAMGIGALSAMQEQEQAIAILSNAVASCQREIASLAIDHATFKKDITKDAGSCSCILQGIGRELDLFKQARLDQEKTLSRRLCWLFLGR